ncbi:hypothetical protein MCEGE14_01579 [Burkholderiaceae bacterium]
MKNNNENGMTENVGNDDVQGDMPNEVRRNLVKKISLAGLVVPAAIILTDASTNVAFAS